MPNMRWVPHLIHGVIRPEYLALKQRSYHILARHACLECLTRCHEEMLYTCMLIGLTWQDGFQHMHFSPLRVYDYEMMNE